MSGGAWCGCGCGAEGPVLLQSEGGSGVIVQVCRRCGSPLRVEVRPGYDRNEWLVKCSRAECVNGDLIHPDDEVEVVDATPRVRLG